MKTLDEETYSKISKYSESGDSLLEQGYGKAAIAEYTRALGLLPEPIHEWEAATWLFTAIADAYWTLRDYEEAYKALQSALLSPEGIGNPFIHLRLGQIHYELGDMKRAIDDLLRAYMGADEEIFEGEDPKYFLAIKDMI